MAAPKNNQFWKNRSEHGRDYLFETPDALWQACTEYFNWCDAHPWYKMEAIKGGDFAGKLVKVPTAIPYTLTGLCIYLGASENYWHSFRKNVNLSEDFLLIVSRVEEIITTQQFTGATVGAFNANIIARKLGLTDKQEIEQKNFNYNSEPLTPDKVRELEELKKTKF